MVRTVRVGPVDGQDALRREDLSRMSPAERVAALVAMRDRAAPVARLRRIVSIRHLA